MSEPIHDVKLGSGDVPVSNGYYAINAAGDLVLLPPRAPLKGMRLATQADLDEKSGKEPVAAPPEPAPAVAAPMVMRIDEAIALAEKLEEGHEVDPS